MDEMRAYPSTFNGHSLVAAETTEPMNALDYFKSAWRIGQLVRIEFPSRWDGLAPEYRKPAALTGRIVTATHTKRLRRFEVTIDGWTGPITVYEESEQPGEPPTVEAMLTPLPE